MQISLVVPEKVEKIIEKFKSAEFEIYLVGGAVRDLLMGREVHDWDFTSQAKPEEIMKLFPKNSFYNNSYGTVGIIVNKEVLEVTTYRSESDYEDFRRPNKITWGKNISEDLKRRDFTINSIAVGFSEFKDGQAICEIVDPYFGIRDLKNKLIKTVGKAEDRFEEDALRMLRAIRIACQLGFSLDHETVLGIKKQAKLIKNISAERIGMEFLKILEVKRADLGIILLKECGLLQFIIPELLEGIGVEQKGHHIYDVWTHSTKALEACKSQNPVTKLAVLLHDVGKPRTLKTKKSGERTFYNHEVVGSRMAVEIAKRLRLSAKQQDLVFKLVRWHMFSADTSLTDSAVRRIITNVSPEYLDELIALRQADRIGSGAKETSWRWEALKARFVEVQKQPFGVKDLKVNGEDVMKIQKIGPSKKVGEILNWLFVQVEKDISINEREKLLKLVKEYAEK